MRLLRFRGVRFTLHCSLPSGHHYTAMNYRLLDSRFRHVFQGSQHKDALNEAVLRSIIPVIVCFAQDGAIVSWICWWLVSSTISFVTSPAHHPIALLFPGSRPLIWLCLLPFFHCFNAACQIECFRVTTLSFLDYRTLEVLFFFLHPSLCSFSSSLSSPPPVR